MKWINKPFIITKKLGLFRRYTTSVDVGYWECSNCNFAVLKEDVKTYIIDFNYCPRCGKERDEDANLR